MTAQPYTKFGFIVHCRSVKELRLALLRYRFSPLGLFPDGIVKSYCLKQGSIKDIFTFHDIRSDADGLCQGKAFCVFLNPEQMLENQVLSTELVKKACRMAEDWGAQMIGLGALTAVVGARGIDVAESCSVSVTTGNSLTVYASIIALDKISQQLDIDLAQQKIIIIGFPGSIALALTKILIKRGLNLILVSHRKTAYIDRFLKDLGANAATVEITQNVTEALGKGKIIFSATSTGNIIDPDKLPPGSIVFDIAQPRDVIYKNTGRSDILVIDTGTLSLPRATTAQYRYSGLGINEIPSCLGETMTLTLEKRWENFSMGRELPLDKIEEIGRLSERHGFIFDAFRSFQKPIPELQFEMTKRALHQAYA